MVPFHFAEYCNIAMLQLTYASRATKPLRELELRHLLVGARQRNTARGVTGILLYHDGTFVQCLEGPSAAVHEAFEKIRSDPRHHDVRVLERRSIQARQYGDWSMGFLSVNRQLLESSPGFRDVIVRGPEATDAPEQTRKLLDELLKGGLRRQVNT